MNVNQFDYDMKEYMIQHQYHLPSRLQCYAKYYPNVSFSQALELYALAVQETITIFNAKNLFDTPLSFGKGLTHAKNIWREKMQEAEVIAAASKKKGEIR